MILNKRKFKIGLKKTILAITLAFIGPILFVLGSGEEMDSIKILLTILGGLIMILCVIIGILGLKDILAGFFEHSNE